MYVIVHVHSTNIIMLLGVLEEQGGKDNKTTCNSDSGVDRYISHFLCHLYVVHTCIYKCTWSPNKYD